MTGQVAPPFDLEEVRRCVRRALDRLLQVPGFWYKIAGIELVPKTSMATGRNYSVVRIAIETNNRPLALGQFLGFPVDGLRGYHPNYVFGYVHGYLEGRYGAELWNEYSLILDVADGPGHTSELYRYITVDEAIGEGFLGDDSPLSALLRKYDLRYVLASGSIYSGPSYSMMRAVEQVVHRYRISSMVDVCAGTCSLTKVACAHGVTRAVCIDPVLDVEKASRNLGEHVNRCEFVARDARELPWLGTVDLLVVDPFYEFALDTLSQVVAKSLERFRYLVFNLGLAENRYWVGRILAAMDALDLTRLGTFSYGEDVVLCQPLPTAESTSRHER